MKRNILNNFLKLNTSLFLLVGSLFFLASCDEEDPTAPLEASAPPVVQSIRVTAKDSTIQKSTLGSTIVIVGENLAATQYVVFNGYQTTVNPVYATNTHLIVRIPDQVPTVATASNLPNELKVVNSAGETTYSFEVLPPAPIVENVSNEFAKAGETITLTGSYFYFVEEVIFPGDVVSTEFTASADGNSLMVKVPAGVDPTNAENSELIVRSQSGNSAVNQSIKFNDRTGMLVDWDTKVTGGTNPLNSGWGISENMSKVTNSYPGISPVDGLYGLIDMAIAGNWSWANAKLVNMSSNDANVNGGKLYPTTPSAMYNPEASIANFDLRAEIAATQPVGELILQVWQANGGKEYTASVPLADFVKTTDGKWYTISVNLADLAADNGATKFTGKYKDFIKPADLRILIQNPSAVTVPTTMAIDNIRIVNIVQ